MNDRHRATKQGQNWVALHKLHKESINLLCILAISGILTSKLIQRIYNHVLFEHGIRTGGPAGQWAK